VWAGHRTVLAGDRAVNVGWDGEPTAAAVREATAAWPETVAPPQLPVTIGIRVVAVGLRRRRMWLVHFGTPVRHRADDLAGAADFVHGMLRSVARGAPADDEVSVPIRAYVRGTRAVLVHVRDDVDIDERPLRKRGIEQLPVVSVLLRPAERSVLHAGQQYMLAGAVVDARLLPEGAVLDDARRHLLALGEGARDAWAWALDALGEQIGVAAAADVGSEIRRILG
jgi:hypothetical protein